MVDVCETMQTRLEKGDYTQMCCSVTDPWKELMHCQRKRMAELDVPESEQKQKANRHKQEIFLVGVTLCSHCFLVAVDKSKACCCCLVCR